MKKRLFLTLLSVCILAAALAGVKFLQVRTMIDQGKKFVPPAETVTSAPVTAESWDRSLTAVGTLNAIHGVLVAAELSGKVVAIEFEPGTFVKKGDVLVRQDISSEEAQLPGAAAQVTLAKTNLERSDKLLEKGIISRADRDSAVASAAQAEAQVANIRATIAKKTIRAPFSGHLGIRQVNMGQTLREGDQIVTLQALDPIYVDFSLPEQQLGSLKTGLPVTVKSDGLPNGAIKGRITAISPQVDSATRNIKVEATISNKDGKLRPGMFVNVGIGLPGRKNVLVVPATAVLYAPYSDSVFVIEEAREPKGGKILRQQFVRLEEKRGDFVAIESGLKQGETIVSTGVFKLRNGQGVVVNNSLSPEFKQAPKPENN